MYLPLLTGTRRYLPYWYRRDNVSWNDEEFALTYSCLSGEVRVGAYYLRYVLSPSFEVESLGQVCFSFFPLPLPSPSLPSSSLPSPSLSSPSLSSPSLSSPSRSSPSLPSLPSPSPSLFNQ